MLFVESMAKRLGVTCDNEELYFFELNIMRNLIKKIANLYSQLRFAKRTLV